MLHRLALTLALTSALAQAAPQPPAFRRHHLGAFQVTVLSDGTLPCPVADLLTSLPRADIDSLLAASFEASPYEMSFNSYLVDTGARRILIDAGAGPLLGPRLGHLTENLRAAGYTPDQIDEVALTHLHEDHVGGLADHGRRVFPNAVVRADKAETEHWLSTQKAAAAPAAQQKFYSEAALSLQPYIQAGKLQPFAENAELAPGVRARGTHGHTPGHTVYVVQSQGQQLELWGDLVHVAEVQLPHPETTIQFDSDPTAAARQRLAQLEAAVASHTLVGAAHISFPGLGHLVRRATGFGWVPLNYRED